MDLVPGAVLLSSLTHDLTYPDVVGAHLSEVDVAEIDVAVEVERRRQF